MYLKGLNDNYQTVPCTKTFTVHYCGNSSNQHTFQILCKTLDIDK